MHYFQNTYGDAYILLHPLCIIYGINTMHLGTVPHNSIPYRFLNHETPNLIFDTEIYLRIIYGAKNKSRN